MNNLYKLKLVEALANLFWIIEEKTFCPICT